MKLRILLVMLMVVLTIGLIGCQNSGKPIPEQNVKENGEGIIDPTQEKLVVTANKKDPRLEGMATKLNEFSFDLDGDGVEEIVELHTAAERAENGEMAWDDGQNWLLVVVDDNDYYPLLQQYVQLGTVYFTVTEDNDGNSTITIIVNTGVGLKIMSFSYDKNLKAYAGEVVYETCCNHVFSAFIIE